MMKKILGLVVFLVVLSVFTAADSSDELKESNAQDSSVGLNVFWWDNGQ